ncbi:MAG: hypothetical protein JO212_18650 [Acetobacteraceae bacterium]|nr:hypothetical protein [Acetobacteraceae bacterium]
MHNARPPSDAVSTGSRRRILASSLADTQRPAIAVAVLVMFIALLLMRRPSVLLHADFWAEDGWVWFPDAYNLGWGSLLRPHAGYLQFLSRAVGLFAQLFPIAWAPAIFAAAGLLIQALPAAFLVSHRMQGAWPSSWARWLFALGYIGLPNSDEVYANLTNGQWHLAVLAFLVLVSDPPTSWRSWAFDVAVLILSGLTGPFCLMLLPVAGWQVLRNRENPAAFARLSLVLVAVLVQSGVLLATIANRIHGPLGAGPRTLARIVSMQILLGAALGQPAMWWLRSTSLWADNTAPVLMTIAGLMLALLGAYRGSRLLRQACLFAALLLAAALLQPQVAVSDPQWPLMTVPGIGARYYYIPMLVWVGLLFALASDEARPLRWAGALLLGLLPVGIALCWKLPELRPTSFPQTAQAFAIAPAGTRMEFPLHPTGAPPMVLIKRE